MMQEIYGLIDIVEFREDGIVISGEPGKNFSYWVESTQEIFNSHFGEDGLAFIPYKVERGD